MPSALSVLALAALVWLVAANVARGLALAMAVRWCREFRHKRECHPIDVQALRPLKKMLPPVAVIVPVHNEAGIVESVRALLSPNVSAAEIIVVNDAGDATLDQLVEAFRLRRSEVQPAGVLPSKQERGVYLSTLDARLLVIDNERGGRADALNAGLNFCRTPYFVPLDAGARLEPGALHEALAVMLEDPESIVAFRGIATDQPGAVWAAGWAAANGLLLARGSFALLRRSACIAVGGFDTGLTAGEADLSLRLHRHSREHRLAWHIAFAPTAAIRPISPRAGTGLRDSLRAAARYPRLHIRQTALIHQTVFNPAAPSVDAATLPLMAVAYYFGLIHWVLPILYLTLATFPGVLLSLAATLIGNLYLAREHSRTAAVRGIIGAVVDGFGWRWVRSIASGLKPELQNGDAAVAPQ